MACCKAMVFISLKVCLMVVFGIWNIFSTIFVEGMCIVTRVVAIMTISGSTLHPLFKKELVSRWYFLVFVLILLDENLSLQYMNFMN